MGGMDQDALRFEGNCTLKLPKTSTHCTGCFGTIAAFRDKVCCTTGMQSLPLHVAFPAWG